MNNMGGGRVGRGQDGGKYKMDVSILSTEKKEVFLLHSIITLFHTDTHLIFSSY